MAKVEQLKQEISEYYLDNLKDELWWFKSLALLPIEKKVKDILIGKKKLPENFNEVEEFWRWKNIINFISPTTANKIFDFMKEKRLEIEKRKTERELNKLKAQILGVSLDDEDDNTHNNIDDSNTIVQWVDDVTQWSTDASQQNTSQVNNNQTGNDENSQSNTVIRWMATSVGWVAWTVALSKSMNTRELKKMSEWLTWEQVKWTVENAIDALKKQKRVLGSRLSSKQIKSINKHIRTLEKWLPDIGDETVGLLKSWQKLEWKLPKELLKETGLTVDQLSKIEKHIPELSKAKNIDEAKRILRQKNITDINDDVLKALLNAGSEQEMKTMTRILKHGNKMNKFLQTLSWAMLIDVAFAGLDVWMYLETQKEADLIEKVNKVRAENKRNQATWQAVIAGSSFAAEVVLAFVSIGSGGGPLGVLAWLAIGAATAAVSMWVDSLYFDVNDFYTQNKEDFLRQEKAKRNQAILQLIHNQKKWNISLNEKVHHTFNDSVDKEHTLEDACWSTIFMDELQNGKFDTCTSLWEYVSSGKSKEDFLATLSDTKKTEFNTKWTEIEKKIHLRMEYIVKVFRKNTVIDKIKGAGGMQYLSEIFTQSKIYAQMKEDNKRDDKKSIEENSSVYKMEFFSGFPKNKLEKIENIKKEQPYLFQELFATFSRSSLLREDEESPNYNENVKLVEKYREWLNLTQLDVERYVLQIPDSHKNVNFIEKFIEADFDLNKVKYTTNTEEDIIAIVQQNQERNGTMEYSDNILQNVMYRLAKELYGYTGNNDKNTIMEFYSEWTDGVHGVYYKDKRKVNNDWTIDKGLLSSLWRPLKNKDVEKRVNQFIVNFTSKSTIDTATESIDRKLQKELENKIRVIVTEELSVRTEENKEEVKNQIKEFIKKQASNGRYVELPYFLLISAKRAGLGDLQRQFFTYKNGKIEVCLMQSELTNTQNIAERKSYITKVREKFTPEEQQYIDKVESAHMRLENLRNVEWSWLGWTKEDELDIPKEIEILISDKYKEREALKANLLVYDIKIAKSLLTNKAMEMEQYFDELYRGILILQAKRSLWDFKRSNDVDSIVYYDQALKLWKTEIEKNKYIFDQETGKLNISDGMPIQDTILKQFYDKQLNHYTINIDWKEKTITELWASKYHDEKNLAKEASEKIFLVILEGCLLNFDKNGNIDAIKSWKGNLNGLRFDNSMFVKKIQSRIKKYLEAITILPHTNMNNTNVKGNQKIVMISEKGNEVVKNIFLLQQQIEERKDNIVWQWKRWNIIFDPETSEVKSWGVATKIEEKNWKISFAEWKISGSVEEMLWLINITNRIQWEYLIQHPEFKGKFQSDWIEIEVNDGVVFDTTILSTEAIKQNFPYLNNKQKLEQFIEYLNTL